MSICFILPVAARVTGSWRPGVMLMLCVRGSSTVDVSCHSMVNSGALSRAWWISPEVAQQLFNLMYVLCVKVAIKSLSLSLVHTFRSLSGCDQYFSMHVQDLQSAGGSVTYSFASIFAPGICQVNGNKRGLQFKPRARGKACSLPCNAGTYKIAIFVVINSSLATATAARKRLWNVVRVDEYHPLKVDFPSTFLIEVYT